MQASAVSFGLSALSAKEPTMRIWVIMVEPRSMADAVMPIRSKLLTNLENFLKI
jgi:hypothetical protein